MAQKKRNRTIPIALTLIMLELVGASTPKVGLAQSIRENIEPEWIDLTDDESRGQLAHEEVLEFAKNASEKQVLRQFLFPENARDGRIYGIDVSHHNGVISWPDLKGKGIRFAYIKASQGDHYRDPMFNVNWAAAGNEQLGIRRGAYHFLSACVSGKAQARAYLAMLRANGGLRNLDLAPVVDLEWDYKTVNGKKVDRWASCAATTTGNQDAIIEIVRDWLAEVGAATRRKPLIYTARNWWVPRLAKRAELNSVRHWIADYRAVSIQNRAPLYVPGNLPLAWQFTDVARVRAGLGKVDANQLSQNDLEVLSGK